ncbi:hypothetical protein GA0074695_6502 [Micromonospora viridifaciens]|uniref:Uncharacterized protein n=1 Tax=Micromonospora viridifaciens TaxID=1881 RepID=A0A1C5A1R0_MICVI|nr:hypothetical protein GA0074695_6502 [Micromonospora viridifaciens]
MVPAVPVACPIEREPRVNGGQYLDVPAGTARQVEPGHGLTTGRIHTS